MVLNTAKYVWTRAIVIALMYAVVASFALVALSIPTAAIVKLIILSTFIVIAMVKVLDIV